MGKLKPIAKEDRRVVNVKNANYTPFISDGIEDGFVLQLGDSKSLGSGFHIYRMKPGQTTVAHKHQSDEEFYIIEGDLIDHDGTKYGPGDLVWLTYPRRLRTLLFSKCFKRDRNCAGRFKKHA